MRPIRLDPDNKQLEKIVVGLARQGEWSDLLAFIRSEPPEAAFIALQLLGLAAPLDLDLRPLISAERPLELTVAGALLCLRATRFRGLDVAANVSDDQWELYIPTLAHAQELLGEAARLAPELGLAAAWRVRASVDASEEEKDAAELGLRKARDIPVSGLSRLISMRAEKWGGSHDEMWRVARDYADAAPPGSIGLIARAHFEQWLWLADFEEDEKAAARAETYFSETQVREELDTSSRCLLAADSGHDPRALIHADNCFAVAYWVAELPRLARPHLKRMGKNLDETLWPFEKPRRELNRARLRARLLPV